MTAIRKKKIKSVKGTGHDYKSGTPWGEGFKYRYNDFGEKFGII